MTLSPRTVLALGRAAGRELLWGLREVSREVDRWRSVAAAIPDLPLREDALLALERKRPNLDGAALFWTLPQTRSPSLLRLLVAYEILADYLDCVSERAAEVGIGNGLQLHQALVDAVDPALAPADYYRYHPWKDDGGYVRLLVGACREGTAKLPSYNGVRPLAVRAAEFAQVLALNHEPDRSLRDTALRQWATDSPPGLETLPWFERTAGASAWLTILALLALSADARRDVRDARETFAAYMPWISLAGTMLDSYGDAVQDKTSGDHSYIAHYRTRLHANARLAEIIAHAIDRAGALPNGERHSVLTSSMVAMYLSKDSARTRENRQTTRRLARAAGPLPTVLLPVLRTWRVINGQQADRSDEDRSIASTADQRTLRSCRSTLPPSPLLPVSVQTLAFWRDPHAYLAWCRNRYGSRFTVHALGMAPMVFVSKPEDIKAIVRAPADVLHPGAGAAVIAPLVGEGSFMLAEEDDHLTGRRAILPGLQHQRIRGHADMVDDVVRREISSWPRDTPVRLHPYLRALTLHVILHTLFGAEQRELHRHLLSMLSVTGSLALQEPQLRTLPPWRGIWRQFITERAEANRIISRLIENEAHAPARDNGLLETLLNPPTASQEHASPTQVRDDLMSVILAGHETTASQLAWAFQLIAHHPRVASRLAQSLDAGEDHYLTATLHEVLRHRPVFLFTIPRNVNAPFELADTLYLPPAQLVGCIHLMQHDPTIYPHPERFWPERFLQTDPSRELWLPWGGGRKRCPGHHLAMVEMSTVLKIAFANLEALPVDRRVETARWRSVIVTPGRGSRIILHDRRQPRSRRTGTARFFRSPDS